MSLNDSGVAEPAKRVAERLSASAEHRSEPKASEEHSGLRLVKRRTAHYQMVPTPGRRRH